MKSGKHRRGHKKTSARSTDVHQQTKVSLKSRIVALLVFLSIGGLLLAGYALGPDRRWITLFSSGERLDRAELQALWTQILQLDRCLIGEQDYSGRSAEDGCVLSHPLCRKMLRAAREETGVFLVEQMASRQETQIHTCPYSLAKEGELAIYFLQHLTKTNWFTYSGSHPALRNYILIRQNQATGTAEYEPSSTEQQLLWKILDDPETLEELQEFYLQQVRS